MSEKKRTTVTTIETHEVWIIRNVTPEPHNDEGMIAPLEKELPATTPPASELDNKVESNGPKESTEQES